MKTNKINLTDAEQKVLVALTEDEYFVWDTPHRSSIDLPKASVPGVITSLMKKGIVERFDVERGFGRDSYIRLTDVGVEITRSLYPERVTGWPHQDAAKTRWKNEISDIPYNFRDRKPRPGRPDSAQKEE